MSEMTSGLVEPVAWRWEGRNRQTGHWERNLTSYRPEHSDPKYCRNVEPLYLHPARAPLPAPPAKETI